MLMCIVFFLTVAGPALASNHYEKYSTSFFDVFDTVTQLIGFTESEDLFKQVSTGTHDKLLHYHRIFDGYNSYEGINNLYYVNHNAENGPVKADPELIEFLLWVVHKQEEVPEGVNIAMGAVLEVWHNYRTIGEDVPPIELLEEKACHIDIRNLVIDPENGTVFFKDPYMRLDVGAVAKGYTVEKTAEWLETVMPSFLISVGGNVRSGDKPLDGRSKWGISIQNPGDGVSKAQDDYLDVMYLTNLSVVTSGDYQRYYVVDGVRYHHIIDPKTLMPSRYVRAVTVVTEDSGYADLLSTTLYLMPYETAKGYVESLDGVEAYWVLNDGTIMFSDGLKIILRSQGASSRD